MSSKKQTIPVKSAIPVKQVLVKSPSKATKEVTQNKQESVMKSFWQERIDKERILQLQ